MTAFVVTLSTFGLISAAVIWVAFSLWGNWRSDRRMAARYHKAWLGAIEEAHQARIQLIRYQAIVSAAEEWRDACSEDREAIARIVDGVDADLIDAVDWRRNATLPPPTGEPIT